MKQLSQLIFFSILGESALPIILALGTFVILIQIFQHKIFISKTSWLLRKQNKEIEDNMWLIE
ncbi:MAG: hypothetical protein ABIN25_08815 [Ginsengibacter sp.]